MAKSGQLTRRDFLKVSGINLAALACPRAGLDFIARAAWPSLSMDQIPGEIQAILQRVPETMLGPDGYLLIKEPNRGYYARAPQAVTEWNRENSTSADRLYPNVSWGIVLHWYGDKENFDCSVKGYIRGFDSLREVDGEILRTSAHFLVGNAKPIVEEFGAQDEISILQTQAPAKDGTPYVASHLRPINYQAHQERKQYFVRALYEMGYNDPTALTLLQEIYDGRKIDPNMRTIAIEITGYSFDKADHYPGAQKIANVLSLVWALMKRYKIPASSLLGHHEIQLSKADPGKKFMALIRHLIAVKALVEPDEQMKQLVFGRYLGSDRNNLAAVKKYLEHVRGYLVLVSTPRTAYEWEEESKYWFTVDSFSDNSEILKVSREFLPPFRDEISILGSQYLLPENHEGIDLCQPGVKRGVDKPQSSGVNLILDGRCVFVGESHHCRHGKAAIFRHRQPDGAEILSIYSHLQHTSDIQVGREYPCGYVIGRLDHPVIHEDSFLHFSLAYGASWDVGLKHGPEIPLNAGTNWITRRYLDPLAYVSRQQRSIPEINVPIHSKI